MTGRNEKVLSIRSAPKPSHGRDSRPISPTVDAGCAASAEGDLELIAMMRAGFPDVRWTLEETVTEGDTAAARFTMRGTHQGEFFGILASGKTISVQAMNFY
ncbi:ester cyclase [Lentzea sp. NBC_00516]|uniref:ester cyclase n=1 Tax=Lentzea sp. NBC_00516 TaxID=2903582 RepID=UPI002E8047EF|nr:ester cyclase [Lentzea sp. NBC_00516]WUD28530.1 ester cyclase [Lentzea sp. NBC_00516]